MFTVILDPCGMGLLYVAPVPVYPFTPVIVVTDPFCGIKMLSITKERFLNIHFFKIDFVGPLMLSVSDFKVTRR